MTGMMKSLRKNMVIEENKQTPAALAHGGDGKPIFN